MTMLKKIFRIQKDFQIMLLNKEHEEGEIQDINELTISDRVKRVNEQVTSLRMEFHELRTAVDKKIREDIYEELIDVLHFILNIYIYSDVSHEAISEVIEQDHSNRFILIADKLGIDVVKEFQLGVLDYRMDKAVCSLQKYLPWKKWKKYKHMRLISGLSEEKKNNAYTQAKKLMKSFMELAYMYGLETSDSILREYIKKHSLNRKRLSRTEEDWSGK